MERARTRIDDDEWYLDVDPEEVKGEGAVVETEHFFVGQAFNAHIQAVSYTHLTLPTIA